MSETAIEQAVFVREGNGSGQFRSRSPGFREEWCPDTQRLCDGFGSPSAGMECPTSVFAHRLTRDQVAVVQVCDLGTGGTKSPGSTGFRLLIIPRLFYEEWIGDPFVVADRFPPRWQDKDPLLALSWPFERLPNRKVEEIKRLLRPADDSSGHGISQSATLLGGAQALVDGGRLVFERSVPDPEIVRNLWLLLPTSSRCKLWPATFAFSNALQFDVVIVPRARGEDFARYLTEEQAGDYPEGRYEMGLQFAAESGDQQELDRLFARRSITQTLRLGLIILACSIALVLGVKLLNTMMFAPKAGGPAPATQPSETGKGRS